jgi:uncharacterized membrane protein
MNRWVQALRWSIVAGSVLWAAALPIATLAAARQDAASVPYALALVTYGTGSIVCHQLPARSFHLWGAQMPVCARCTGLYLGAAVVAIALTFRSTDKFAIGPSAARRLLVVAALPTIATLVIEWSTGHMPSNWIRAATGVCLGAAAAAVVLAYAREAEHPEVN